MVNKFVFCFLIALQSRVYKLCFLGETLFLSNNFAGFVGVYNGLKPNTFTITANERFMLEGGLWGMFRYVLGRFDRLAKSRLHIQLFLPLFLRS